MKYLFLVLLIVIVGFAIMADTTISFKPFSIKFGSPYNAVGYLLIFSGIAFIKIDSERKGARKAIDVVTERIEEIANDQTNK